MSKKIISIGYEIPGHSDDYVSFGSEQSLMEADVLLISPDSLKPNGHWVSFTSSDSGCYDVDASRIYKQKISHFKKEVTDHLKAGKNVFMFLTKKEEFSLAYNVSTEKKQRLYSTELYHNYNFLPIDIGVLTSAAGRHVEFVGNSVFSEFYKSLKEHFRYQLYIENPKGAQVIFTGKDKAKILGAVFKVTSGHLIVLPYIEYDYDKFTKTKKDKKGIEQNFWTEPAMKFGNILMTKLLQIDHNLKQTSEKTPPPDWSHEKNYILQRESEINDAIDSENKKLFTIKKKITELESELTDEQVLKGLLFEQGKLLEKAVTKALQILGYQAEGFDDGTLEIDHVILSPEGYRFIGECEGKDNKDIDIEKLRQLIETMNADFAREDVSEKSFGLLFGNPQRFIKPDERTLDFTKKCKIGAEREKIALIKTVDLFTVAKHALETNDDIFKKNCRNIIHASLGSVVIFPEIK